MSDQEDAPDTVIIEVDISAWVEKAQNDRSWYIKRQATDIILNAIGSSPKFGEKIFLKGGTLMGIVYQSPRQTADLDFIRLPHDGFERQHFAPILIDF
jgi:predicted nucleotidyltransferase component of viral defense system